MYVVRWYKEILLVETFRKEWSFWNIKATIIFILCNMHMVTQSGEDGQSWNTPLRPWRPGKPVVIWVPISITMTAYRWLLTSVEIAGFQESCGAEQRGGTFWVYLCLLMNCWANLEQTGGPALLMHGLGRSSSAHLHFLHSPCTSPGGPHTKVVKDVTWFP
jgi:hypothetical protein